MTTQADVILTSSFAPVPSDVMAMFVRPTVQVNLPTPPNQGYQAQVQALGPHPIATILARYAPGVVPNRIALLGFSESCQFPRAILRSNDASLVDTAVAIDGIHAQWAGNGSHQIAPGYLDAWIAFGDSAVQTGRQLVITTSSIQPSFVSTTETANAIWQAVTGSSDDREDAPPDPLLWNANLSPPVSIHSTAGGTTLYASLPSTRYRRAGTVGGLILYNYGDLDAPGTNDHILQAKVVLPRALQAYLVQRWNAVDPSSGYCSGDGGGVTSEPSVGGAGCYPATAVPPGSLDLLGDAAPPLPWWRNPHVLGPAAGAAAAVAIGIAAAIGGRR